MKPKKMHGAMLISIVLTMFLIISVSIGFFYLFSASNNSIQAKEKAITAQRYAQEKTEEIKLIPYDEIVSKVSQDTWTTMPEDENWEYFIHLGKEKLIDDDENKKQRIADIKIRQKGQKTEEIVLQQVISSQAEINKKRKITTNEFYLCSQLEQAGLATVIRGENGIFKGYIMKKDGFIFSKPSRKKYTWGGEGYIGGFGCYINGAKVVGTQMYMDEQYQIFPIKNGAILTHPDESYRDNDYCDSREYWLSCIGFIPIQ